MVKSGFNPVRRNRNIGTASQGFTKRNVFRIPSTKRDFRRFFEKLSSPVDIPIILGQHEFTLVVEPAHPSFKYYLSLPDILETLKLVPEADRLDIKFIVLRQPKRKERLFSKVWGRLVYWDTYVRYAGTAVIIEALPVEYSYKFDKNISPPFSKELEALRSDGHIINVGKRHIEVKCPPLAIRRTQLFRTLPHEIGHHLDYKQRVEIPADTGEGDYVDLNELYYARPQREREEFADRYASGIMEPYKTARIIPFAPRRNGEESGLNPDWFYFDPADV